ncbi:hypothetical protein [Glutamicibacter sp.]|uniref:hypothetical protein n=1 Tax=Glutamicibacter sp. TaxID=1931995 RepID=UPI003D6B7A97
MKRLAIVNLLLGVPGIIYYWTLSLMVLREPLTGWGQLLKGWYEANSLLPMQSLLGPPLAICTMIWVLSNAKLISGRTRIGELDPLGGKAGNWGLAVAMSLVPAVLVFLAATFY